LGRLVVFGKETSHGCYSLLEELLAFGLLEAVRAKLLLLAITVLEDLGVSRTQILAAAAVAVARTLGAIQLHGLGLEGGDDIALDKIIRFTLTIRTDAANPCQHAGFCRSLVQGGDKMVAAAPDTSCPFACNEFPAGHLTDPGVLPDPSVGPVDVLAGHLRFDRNEPGR